MAIAAPVMSSTIVHTVVITAMSIVLTGPSLVGRFDSILELLVSSRGEEYMIDFDLTYRYSIIP